MAGYNLKNKEELEQYLKNLYTEYSFGCLSEKNPEVCHLLGEYNEAILKDQKKSAELYKQNCDTFDFARSCYKYARFCVTGEGGCKKSMKTAYQYTKKGCEFGDGEACFYVGLMVTSNDDIGVEKNDKVIKEGLEMMSQACYNMKETRACAHLGKMYLHGVNNLVQKNIKASYPLFEKSCNESDPAACYTLAQMYSRGIETEKNLELADKFRKKGAEIEEFLRKNAEIQFQQGA